MNIIMPETIIEYKPHRKYTTHRNFYNLSKGDIEDVLWKNSVVHPDTGCYLWLGRIDKDGYGFVKIGGKDLFAHRLSAFLFLGLKLKSKILTLHKILCPHKNCWRPEHLYLGNQSNNQYDMQESMAARGMIRVKNKWVSTDTI